MQTLIENDTRKQNAEKRKEAREIAKMQKRIEEAKSQPRLESLTITIEWKKSRMWGMNPHATGEAITKEGRRIVGTAKASGCGYCKRSTVIADLFNQFLRHKLFDESVLTRLKNGKPYGISIPKDCDKWLPYFEGGIGEGCYLKISEVIGGKWETVAYTGSVEVYRYSEMN
ncbi:MAG: hypothetical protein EBR82_52655 [Caulobacteraceae bacterium]|nr:hypothetical protein [Caulobacteraceae bacterium]